MILDYKSITLFDKPLFTWALVKTPMTLSGGMLHNEACFAYILEGSCLTYTGKEVLSVHQQEAFLSKCGNYTTKLLAKEGQGNYSTIAIHFHLDVLQKVYKDALPEYLTMRKDRGENMAKLSKNRLIDNYIQGVYCYFEQLEAITEEMLVLKLKEIILLLLNTSNGPEVRAIMQGLFSPRKMEFKEIIDAHLYADLSISELAQLTNRSLSTFKKDFYELYKDTPANYRMTKRLKKVADLLYCSEESVSRIAYDSGFKSIAHLSRVFKRHYGTTPSQYRLNFTDK